MKWGAAPPVLPKGAMMAVMAGDPGASGPVAVRLKMPAGYKIPAHWHPTDEQVTVLSGTLALGMGDKLDKTKGQTLSAGGFGIAPAHMNHYAWTQTGAVIQINLMGPFALTYVNPADDPSRLRRSEAQSRRPARVDRSPAETPSYVPLGTTARGQCVPPFARAPIIQRTRRVDSDDNAAHFCRKGCSVPDSDDRKYRQHRVQNRHREAGNGGDSHPPGRSLAPGDERNREHQDIRQRPTNEARVERRLERLLAANTQIAEHCQGESCETDEHDRAYWSPEARMKATEPAW